MTNPPDVKPDEITIRVAESAAAESGPNAPMYAWFQLFKTAQIHALANQALERPIQAMVDVIAKTVAHDGRLALQTHDRAVFVNGVKLKLSGDELLFAQDIISFFESRDLGGFVVDGVLKPDDVKTLLNILVYAPPQDRTFTAIDEAVGNSGLPLRVTRPIPVTKKSDSEIQLERRNNAFFVYSKLRVLFGELKPETTSAGTRLYLMKKIARSVQTLVDLCLDDDRTLLALASVRDVTDYVSCHAINSAILSIALGARIGLSRTDLADLGLAAVFHDIGLRSLPPDILDKPGALDAGERAELDRHVMKSVDFLLGEKKFNRSSLTRIVVAYEHHRAAVPRPGTRPPDVATRVITIASVFDALATYRPWRGALAPNQVLAIMMRDAGKMFDAALLREFVSVIGLYPAGTLVRLTSGRLAVSLGRGASVTRPIVATLEQDATYGEVLDLATATGEAIAAVEDPLVYGFRASGLVANAPARPTA